MYNLNIKELRKKKGWSQDTLAKKLGVSRQTIVNYEKGEVIPESKKELLYNILQDVTENIVQESSADYQILPGYQRKIFETELEIQEYEKTIELKKSLKEPNFTLIFLKQIIQNHNRNNQPKKIQDTPGFLLDQLFFLTG